MGITVLLVEDEAAVRNFTARALAMQDIEVLEAGTGEEALTLLQDQHLKIDAIISNSFIMYLKPGLELLEKLGGIHKFMNYNKTIFTDSGGFQMLSQRFLRKINDKGVTFNSPFDGKDYFLTPEDVMDIENKIGSDVSMVLDHVNKYGDSYETFKDTLLRTMRWAERCKAHHDKN